MTTLRRMIPLGLAMLLVVATQVGGAAGNGVTGTATGGGKYMLLDALQTDIAFSAIARADGSATGNFHQSVVFAGELVAFHGTVTCVTFDSENHRAWIGGVVTRNDSSHPSFLQERHEVGRDIWFRVVDYGEGADAPADRSTFVGFEGDAGFITSADYCAGQPWPEDDARTWPFTMGNLQVRS